MNELQRLSLQTELEEVMNGSGKVYYLPEANVTIKYPCIIYELSNEDFLRANNRPYHSFDSYDVTIIDRDPTSDIPERLVRHGFSGIRFDRRYLSDNLYHTVYKICYRSDAQ